MFLIRVKDTVINLDHVQYVELLDNTKEVTICFSTSQGQNEKTWPVTLTFRGDKAESLRRYFSINSLDIDNLPPPRFAPPPPVRPFVPQAPVAAPVQVPSTPTPVATVPTANSVPNHLVGVAIPPTPPEATMPLLQKPPTPEPQAQEVETVLLTPPEPTNKPKPAWLDFPPE